MKQHLSGRRISAWMGGERTPEEERHVGGCPECRAEVAGLENAVGLFRGSVREWSQAAVAAAHSDRDLLGGWKPEPVVRRSMTPRWALIAATLVILAVVPIYWKVERHRDAEQARADALLLEQVDAGLWRPVPAPMEPLLSLVPGDIR